MRYWRVDLVKEEKYFVIPMNDIYRCNKMLNKEAINIYPWRDWKPNNESLLCLFFDVDRYRKWEDNKQICNEIKNYLEGL